MDHFLQDLRSGFRGLTRSPGPAAAAVLVLAIGIGLTTAMFSIVNGIVFRGLPFEDGERLYHLGQSLPNGTRDVPLHDFVDWRAQQTSFEDLAAFYTPSVYLSDGETARRYEGARMSANAFAQLRVKPALGSVFTEAGDRPGAEPVIVLGHQVWRDHYGGDPDIVGKTLLADGVPTTVLGVMPEGFRFPIHQDLWLPLKPDPGAAERGKGLYLEVFGRLRDGVTLDEARLELNLIAHRLAEEYPETNEGVGAAVDSYTLEFVSETRRNIGLVCLGAVAFVLLIACFNVANLLFARTTARGKELAVKSALGASRARVLSQVLTESFCLAAPAAVVGLALAGYGVDAFNAAVAGQDWPFWFDVRVSAASLAMVLALTVVSTLVSGLLPALRASRFDVHTLLQAQSRGSGSSGGRLSQGLVVLEVALSCVLLVGAGLMVRTIVNLASIDFAFDTERVFTARMGLPEATYPDEESRLHFWRRLREELARLPGVESAALATTFPGAEIANGYWYGNADKAYPDDKDYTWARFSVVTPGFFATFGAALLEGRVFDFHDAAAGEPVVIVNRSLAEREWPGESALGKRLRLGRGGSEEPWRTVIGVAPDLHMDGLRDQYRAGMYVPLAQSVETHMGIALKTSGEPLATAGTVRELVRRLDRSLPVYFVDSLDGRLDEAKFFHHLMATIFSILGAAALALAAVGVYGVLAFSVSRRRGEVGIRMALGAVARDVLRLVVGQGLLQVGVGLLFGLALAAAVANLMSSQLFGVAALDPLTFASIAALLAAVGIAASLVPAWRAMGVDPVTALRDE